MLKSYSKYNENKMASSTTFDLVFSHCPESLSASTNAQCEANFEPSMKYDSQLAAKLATWSSLTYVDPNIHDKASIQSAVWSQFNGTYQVRELAV